MVEASCDISGHCALESFAPAVFRSRACTLRQRLAPAKELVPAKLTGVVSGRASDVNICSNTLAVVGNGPNHVRMEICVCVTEEVAGVDKRTLNREL